MLRIFLLSTMTLAVVQSFSMYFLKDLYGIRFEVATMTLTASMVCGAFGMLMGGFVATRTKDSDKVLAICMTVGTAFLALCGTSIFGATGTVVVLAATGFVVGVGGLSRDMMIEKATPKAATGRVCGMVYYALDAGFAISSVLLGVFMDRGWYQLTFFGAALAMALSGGGRAGSRPAYHPAPGPSVLRDAR